MKKLPCDNLDDFIYGNRVFYTVDEPIQTEEQLQKEFSLFFNDMLSKYGKEKVGFGLAGLEPNSELDKEILSLVDL